MPAVRDIYDDDNNKLRELLESMDSLPSQLPEVPASPDSLHAGIRHLLSDFFLAKRIKHFLSHFILAGRTETA